MQGIENQLARTKLDYHHMQISDNQYLEKVFENLSTEVESFGGCRDVSSKDHCVDLGLLMSTTTMAALHLGQHYNENLVFYRNTNFKELKTLFDVTQRLILEQDFEILNVSTIEWTLTPWMRSTSLHDTVIKWAKEKVHVHSELVLCLGKIYEHTEANAKWKDQLQEFQPSNKFKGSCGIDGEPLEFEWRIFPGHMTLEILQEIQDELEACPARPERFEDRIVFMSMLNDIAWTKKGHSTEKCSKFRTGQEIRKKTEISAWTLVLPRAQEKMKNGVGTPHRHRSFSSATWTRAFFIPTQNNVCVFLWLCQTYLLSFRFDAQSHLGWSSPRTSIQPALVLNTSCVALPCL